MANFGQLAAEIGSLDRGSMSPVEGAIPGLSSGPLLIYVCFDVCFDVFIFFLFFYLYFVYDFYNK